MRDRYDAGMHGDFEPGSEDRVLCNKLRVTVKRPRFSESLRSRGLG